jgi:hypothetical protein
MAPGAGRVRWYTDFIGAPGRRESQIVGASRPAAGQPAARWYPTHVPRSSDTKTQSVPHRHLVVTLR